MTSVIHALFDLAELVKSVLCSVSQPHRVSATLTCALCRCRLAMFTNLGAELFHNIHEKTSDLL